MSEQKLVSPLLDGIMLGDPISDHDGVRCCPAMREETGEKYIVKIISIPSSQRQMDALILTGAYTDAAGTMEYFKEQADGVIKEAEILKSLSSLQGFLPYEGWQLESIQQNRLGYEVYLLSSYKRSLEKHLSKNTITHHDAVNLALQLCEALSICRRAGYMFVDLKPSNIFLTQDKEFRIGDLGFAALNSMKYSSMPSKYRSVYTPPELHEDLETLNPTADVYAVGMILYQIFNNGQLPFRVKAPATALDAPLNADYEMAAIILKAIDPNPRDRWQTPIEMGQELAAYLNRNGVNNTPIVPPPSQVAAESAPVAVRETDPEENIDETAPNAQDADELGDDELSSEVRDMMAQADQLLSMDMPDQVVVPETPDVDQLDARVRSEMPESEESTSPVPVPDSDLDDDEIDMPSTRSKKSFIGLLIGLILVGLLGYGGYRFYNDYYILPIDSISVDGNRDTISVFVDTDVDQKLLTVACTDTYGNTQTLPLIQGGAEFIGLNPATTYRITLETEGFHKLKGAEPCSYTTSEQTKITGFTGKTGTEDGSVILNFELEGRDAQDWVIRYACDDEEERSISFTGHSVSIMGLTVGKTYTFQLESPAEDLWMVGKTSFTYTASEIIIAQNVEITGCVSGTLTAQWVTPADTTVESWIVRCYSESGYDQTITTTDNHAYFEGIIENKAYTLEVTAAGMTQNARTYVSANPATITSISVDAPQDDYVLTIAWEYEGPAPEGGWLLLYSLDEGENRAVIPCAEPYATIEPRVPGTTYHFSIQAADGSTVFSGKTIYECVETDNFNLHNIKTSSVSASLCPTPKGANWNYKSIGKNDYTSKYAPGAKVSIVIYSDNRAKASEDVIEVMFVIRDANGNVIPDLVHTMEEEWDVLWGDRSRYCELNIPAIPNIPGKYSVEVYFNQQLLVAKSLTITQ